MRRLRGFVRGFTVRAISSTVTVWDPSSCTSTVRNAVRAETRAASASHAEVVPSLRQRMESLLKSQHDPRMFGKGNVFDEYKPTNGAGFYESFQRGDQPNAGWVNETDFEPQPIRP